MMRYISGKYGSAEFSGKDSKDKAIVDMIFGVVSDIKGATSGHMYGTGNKDAIVTISDRMAAVSKFLGSKNFIAGDYLTWVDFFIFE